MIKKDIGKYRIKIDFEVVEENLETDILVDDNGVWILDVNGDFQIADGKRSLEQDLQEGFRLNYYEDQFDPQEGNEILATVKNSEFSDEKAIELKHKIEEWLATEDRINQDTLEVKIERIDD